MNNLKLLFVLTTLGTILQASAAASEYYVRFAAPGLRLPNPAKLEASVTSLPFGTVGNAQTKNLSFTVQNTGGGPGTLMFSELEAPFSISSTTCGDVLQEGLSCVVSVGFTPMQSGSTMPQIFVVSAGAASVSVELSGTGQVQTNTIDLRDNQSFVLPAGSTNQRLYAEIQGRDNAVSYKFYRDNVLVHEGGCSICSWSRPEYLAGNGLLPGHTYRFDVTKGQIAAIRLTYTR